MSRLRIGVVGVGHLGKEHARILSQLAGVELVGVADPRNMQSAAIAQRCGTRAYADHRELLGKVDGVVVAAPTAHHHVVARDFLEQGIAALIEKPLTADLAQAEELVALASRRNATLQVGHIERFNPAFEELQRRPLNPKFITCERLGGFSGRSTDVGAVLDLMVHDIDLVLSLVSAPVRSVSALGVAVLGGHEDLARATLTFENGCVAQLSASRVHPTAVRRMNVWAPEGFVTVDFAKRHVTMTQPNRKALHAGFDSRKLDLATAESVRTELYGHFLQVCELDCNAGDQLTRELEDFAHCIRTGQRPRVDAEDGRDAVALATQILDCIAQSCVGGRRDRVMRSERAAGATGDAVRRRRKSRGVTRRASLSVRKPQLAEIAAKSRLFSIGRSPSPSPPPAWRSSRRVAPRARRPEHALYERPRRHSHEHQIVAGYQRLGIQVVYRPLAQQLLAVIDVAGVLSGGGGIGAVQSEQLADTGMDQQRLQFAGAHLPGVGQHLMFLDEPFDALAFLIR